MPTENKKSWPLAEGHEGISRFVISGFVIFVNIFVKSGGSLSQNLKQDILRHIYCQMHRRSAVVDPSQLLQVCNLFTLLLVLFVQFVWKAFLAILQYLHHLRRNFHFIQEPSKNTPFQRCSTNVLLHFCGPAK